MELVPKQMGILLRDYFNFPARRFHLELLEKMFTGGKYVVNWPTDHGKSYVAAQFFPILSLMKDPDEAHILCNANLMDSKRRLEWIQSELETNHQLVADYPWLRPPLNKRSGVWSKTEMTVSGRSANKPNPSVVATAIKSSDVRGRRGKLIMDDVEGTDSERSVVKRQELMDFIGREAFRCYEDSNESPRPLVIALGTPMHVDSVYFALSANAEFEYFRYPAYQDQRECLDSLCPDCRRVFDHFEVGGKYMYGCYNDGWFTREGLHAIKYLWPDKAPKVEDFRRSLEPQYFAVQMLLDPRAGDPTKLSIGDIQSLMRDGRFESETGKTFVSLDGAGGSKTRWADYAGIAVVRIYWGGEDKLPKLQILEAHKYPDGLFEQVHMAAMLADKYGENGTPLPICFDANSYQGQIYPDTFRHLHPNLRLIPHFTGKGQKYDDQMGITIIRTLLRDNRLEIPIDKLESPGIKALQQEIRDLGDPAAHDHICSAIWFVIRWMYQQARFYGGPQLVNGYGGRGQGIRSTRSFNGRNLWQQVQN